MAQKTEVSIILEHVRSFAAKQEVPIRPLTLLVGENSSGKTTFLGVVSCVFDSSRFPMKPGFNEAPYHLGTFETIATYKGGRYGRDSTFMVGFQSRESSGKEPLRLIATYGGEYGNVVPKAVQLSGGRPVSFDLTIAGTHVSGTFKLTNDETGQQVLISSEIDDPSASTIPFPSLIVQLLMSAHAQSGDRDARESAFPFPRIAASKQFFDWVSEVAAVVYADVDVPFKGSFSFSPIRSKPRRTYDEFSEDYSPEGDHIPTVLARLLGEQPKSPEATQVRDALERFGRESGLFKGIRVKRLGKDSADPFQLQIGVAGPFVNLADVGYGVSQALPLIVQSVLRTRSRVLLMQQPEVHLHPQAQAALGTFFSGLASAGGRTFLVETHSDYLVDRVRQEVARGTIPPEDVLILFFDKPKLETTVWPLTMDRNGNIQGVPPSYRRFFVDEEMRLLRRTAV
ncbi:MAG TPA: AAA family ATPase [Planctomycetaceae bacterium]|nr:AAA family ATPase [Planctomycetaceae bacterium]